MGTDKREDALGVETIEMGADPTVVFGGDTNSGGCWILADMISRSLAMSAKENLVSAF